MSKDPQILAWIHGIDFCTTSVLFGLRDLRDIHQLLNIDIGLFQTKEKFNAKKMALDTINMHRQTAREKQIQIQVTTSIDLPIKINADKLRISQVLNNLLTIAVQFSGADSCI
jgi:signal transduction histidine kinase